MAGLAAEETAMNFKELQKEGLVNISTINDKIKIDLRYATSKNMTKRKLY